MPALDQRPGWIEVIFAAPDEPAEVNRLARLRVFLLPSGLRLFVGRDLEDRERLQEVVRRARGWSILMVLVLGGFAAWFVTKRVLSRVDAIRCRQRADHGWQSLRTPAGDQSR